MGRILTFSLLLAQLTAQHAITLKYHQLIGDKGRCILESLRTISTVILND